MNIDSNMLFIESSVCSLIIEQSRMLESVKSDETSELKFSIWQCQWRWMLNLCAGNTEGQ
jgi:hypothetical protein